MANRFFEHVWVIDTPSAVNVSADDMRTALVRWVVRSAGVSTDRVELADSRGSVMWEEVAQSGSGAFSRESFAPINLRGVRVTTLDRGQLFIYFDLNRHC